MAVNKLKLGIMLGILAGIVDVAPMVAQNLSWDANLSAFFHWVIIGFFISATDIKLKGAIKGITIASISLIPIAFLVWQDHTTIIPMTASTIILGAALGFLINKYGT